MLIAWFIRGPSEQSLERRGGSGSGITTTRPESVSYGTGPPASTETKWRGLGDEPKIAGSTGGFIGLISGIAVFLIISTFIGIYLWNRCRKRLPSKTKRKSGFHNPLPSLSFTSHGSDLNRDPYAEQVDMELNQDQDLDVGDTPKASKFGFARPVYTRQRSSEWELPVETPPRNRHQHQHQPVKLPNQPSEAALPLRTKSARPRSRSSSVSSNGSISTSTSTMKGKERIINPFENPYNNYDESRLSPNPYSARRQGSTSSLGSADASSIMIGQREGTPSGESDTSVRVSQIREGTRFVEKFESRESLAL